MRDSTANASTNAGIQIVTGATLVHALFDNVATVGNATGLVSSGAGARAFLTRANVFANNIGLDRFNNGEIVSYLDNHINNNFSSNGTPSSTQAPQ
jgi:hypothetical protein